MIKSIDTIVNEFDNGLFKKLCSNNYLRSVMLDINDDSLQNLKLTIELGLQSYIGLLILSKKIYVYKLIDQVKVEILINPIESSTILEYHILVNKEGEFELTRIR